MVVKPSEVCVFVGTGLSDHFRIIIHFVRTCDVIIMPVFHKICAIFHRSHVFSLSKPQKCACGVRSSKD
jgi:hypothetical protein